MSSKLYLFSAPGILKLFTLVIGAAAYGLGVYSYDETTIQEEFFLRSVQFILVISLIYFSIYLIITDKLVESDMNKALDIGFHLTAAITLLVAGCLIIYSAVDNERTYCDIIYAVYPYHFCQFYGIKLTAGIVTMANGLLYSAVAPSVFFMGRETHRTKQRPNQLNNSVPQLPPRAFYFGAR